MDVTSKRSVFANINYYMVPYVKTTATILDEIMQKVNISQSGDRQLIVDKDELRSAMDDEDGFGVALPHDSEAGKFVLAVLDQLEEDTADIYFYC